MVWACVQRVVLMYIQWVCKAYEHPRPEHKFSVNGKYVAIASRNVDCIASWIIDDVPSLSPERRPRGNEEVGATQWRIQKFTKRDSNSARDFKNSLIFITYIIINGVTANTIRRRLHDTVFMAKTDVCSPLRPSVYT